MWKDLPKSVASDRSSERALPDDLLDDNPMRFVSLPIHFHKIWESYKAHEAHMWTAEDVDVSDIKKDLDKLPQAIREAFLALLVNDSCTVFGHSNEELGQAENFDHEIYKEFKFDKCAATMALASDLQIPEARAFYGFQASYENILLELQSIGLLHACNEDHDEMHRLIEDASKKPNAVRRAGLWHRHVWDENELGIAETVATVAERVFANGALKMVQTLGHRMVRANILAKCPELKDSCIDTILKHTIETAERHLAFNAMIHHSLVQPVAKGAAEELIQMFIAHEFSFFEEVFCKDFNATNNPYETTLVEQESLALRTIFGLCEDGPQTDLVTTMDNGIKIRHFNPEVQKDSMVLPNVEQIEETKALDQAAMTFNVNDDSDF